MGSIPGPGRSSGEGMATHSSILAGRIPWTQEPHGLQSIGSQESNMTEVMEHACSISHSKTVVTQEALNCLYVSQELYPDCVQFIIFLSAFTKHLCLI